MSNAMLPKFHLVQEARIWLYTPDGKHNPRGGTPRLGYCYDIATNSEEPTAPTSVMSERGLWGQKFEDWLARKELDCFPAIRDLAKYRRFTSEEHVLDVIHYLEIERVRWKGLHIAMSHVVNVARFQGDCRDSDDIVGSVLEEWLGHIILQTRHTYCRLLMSDTKPFWLPDIPYLDIEDGTVLGIPGRVSINSITKNLVLIRTNKYNYGPHIMGLHSEPVVVDDLGVDIINAFMYGWADRYLYSPEPMKEDILRFDEAGRLRFTLDIEVPFRHFLSPHNRYTLRIPSRTW